MDDNNLKQAIAGIKSAESKRKFKQTVDIIINLRGLDLKNPSHQVEFFLQLPKFKGKHAKICGLVGAELYEQAQEKLDGAVRQSDFEEYQKDKKKAKKLAEDFDFFVAQANIMPKVAAAFGRVLGPKGKMPNPKAGCVVPPNANLEQIHAKLQQTVKISAKKSPLVQTMVGKEDASEEDIMENIRHIYTNLVHHLPQGENNIKSMFIKLTMGKPIKVI